MAVGTFISTGRSLDKAVERVRLAEELDFESTWVTQIAGRDALTVLTVYAGATERIRLGTGVVPIYTRVPATMAQTAATLDEYSGGRHNVLCAIGDADEMRAGIERYHEAGATSPCVGPIPGTDFESTLQAASALT